MLGISFSEILITAIVALVFLDAQNIKKFLKLIKPIIKKFYLLKSELDDIFSGVKKDLLDSPEDSFLLDHENKTVHYYEELNTQKSVTSSKKQERKKRGKNVSNSRRL